MSGLAEGVFIARAGFCATSAFIAARISSRSAAVTCHHLRVVPLPSPVTISGA